MGCYPIGKMVSKALRKCKGRKRRGAATTTMVYSSPPTYSYPASVAKHVTWSHDSPAVVMMPSEPTISKHHSEAVIPPPPQPEEQRRVRFAAGPDHPDEVPHHGPFTGRTPKESVQGRFDVGPRSGPDVHEPVPPNGPGYRYMTSPSPLPRWEEGEGRREYFGGEYNYYPTPIREGIYRIATDENRLTTIFSEENPNACSIV